MVDHFIENILVSELDSLALEGASGVLNRINRLPTNIMK